MDNREAMHLLNHKRAEYQQYSCAQLVARIGKIETFEISGPSGITYQLEMNFMWDSELLGDLRIGGSIDDRRTASRPLASGIIVKSPARRSF
jgi:hypothetical protein